jgi:hypothetical protein
VLDVFAMVVGVGVLALPLARVQVRMTNGEAVDVAVVSSGPGTLGDARHERRCNEGAEC